MKVQENKGNSSRLDLFHPYTGDLPLPLPFSGALNPNAYPVALMLQIWKWQRPHQTPAPRVIILVHNLWQHEDLAF